MDWSLNTHRYSILNENSFCSLVALFIMQIPDRDLIPWLLAWFKYHLPFSRVTLIMVMKGFSWLLTCYWPATVPIYGKPEWSNYTFLCTQKSCTKKFYVTIAASLNVKWTKISAHLLTIVFSRCIFQNCEGGKVNQHSDRQCCVCYVSLCVRVCICHNNITQVYNLYWLYCLGI